MAPSLTLCWVRYRVYSINYPLAPENNFPDPVIATVRALAYIKAEAQVDSVVIMGDSAGGAVASTVTAVLSAPGLYVIVLTTPAVTRSLTARSLHPQY